MNSNFINRKIPQNIKDINHKNILGFSSKLSSEHPGFNDFNYKKRREEISNIANNFILDTPIPKIKYNKNELYVWNDVLSNLRELYPKYACKQFLNGFNFLNYNENEIPQLEDISNILYSKTGWKIRPVSGLLHPREFLGGLAFKYFHSTQYIRHSSKPHYTPEPDLCHELIGHVPMFLDNDFSRFVQTIGLASLSANDSELWHLTKIYWYMVEFGIIKENNISKAFGAGILSSYGELNNMTNINVLNLPFNPFNKLPRMQYKNGYQNTYFVLNNFEDGEKLLQDYIKTKINLY